MNPHFRSVRRNTHVSGGMLLALLIVAPTFAAAPADPASSSTPRRTLVFPAKEKTRAFLACELAIAMNLNGPATSGDVEQGCTCVNDAYAAADTSIPPDVMADHFYKTTRGEIINLHQISLHAGAELLPGKVKIAAEVLAWEVQTCLGRIPTRVQLTGTSPREWADRPNGFFDYNGPVIAAMPGPARPVDNSLGGLVFVKMRPVHHVVRDYMDTRNPGASNEKMGAFRVAQQFIDSFGRDAGEFPVLSCQYQTQADNLYNRWQSTHAYYYWYKPAWTAVTQELVAKAPAGHPVKLIGAATDRCPVREPKR
jgi:hypothetical protein